MNKKLKEPIGLRIADCGLRISEGSMWNIPNALFVIPSETFVPRFVMRTHEATQKFPTE
jgi:hypothetical protein